MKTNPAFRGSVDAEFRGRHLTQAASAARLRAKSSALTLSRGRGNTLNFVAPRMKRVATSLNDLHDTSSPESTPFLDRERTQWLVTFTELVYVAAIAKLGIFLETEKMHWRGWFISFGLFLSFWSTWIQASLYQAHIIDTGLLEKVWAFCQCFSMVMMGGFVDAFHDEAVMPQESCGCTEGHTDYQVQHWVFGLGLVFSRWTLCAMYAFVASVSEPQYRRLFNMASAIFGLLPLVLVGCVVAKLNAGWLMIGIYSVIILEFALGLQWWRAGAVLLDSLNFHLPS